MSPPACDLLRPVWEQTGGRDGYVSIEVDPNLAHDAIAQYEEARRLHESIDRPNLLVKIPATKAGVTAIEDSIAAGRSINVTLIFSVERYAAVARAYRDGLAPLPRRRRRRRARALGRQLLRLEARQRDRPQARRAGRPAEAEGQAGDRQREARLRALPRSSSRPTDELWAELAAAGAHPQRCLWASTSTKNPAYRDVLYVEELIGPDTVNTMPEETLLAFQDHGRVAPTLERGVDEAQRLLERLAAAGVDYDDVVETLEAEAIEKFSGSLARVVAGLEARRQELAPSGGRR